MGCIDEIPATCRAKGYDYCNSAWMSTAVNRSGETRIARGEVLITEKTVLAPSVSGGIILGSGTVDRVIIRVPETIEAGDDLCLNWCNSGLLVGVWIGGASGLEQPSPDLSGATILSGKGLFLRPGDQKELYVQRVEEIYIAGQGDGASTSGLYPSVSGIYGSGIYNGFPVTWAGEVIVC